MFSTMQVYETYEAFEQYICQWKLITLDIDGDNVSAYCKRDKENL